MGFNFSLSKKTILPTLNVNEIFDSPIIYKEIYNILNMSKFTVVEGGRASCKTQETATFLIRESFRFKDSVILCGREYQSSIKDSVYSTIDKLIKAPKKNRLSDYFKVTDKEIVNVLTNTRFIFRGFNDFKKGSSKKSSNLNKIKSLSSIIYVWIDESQDITSNTLDVLIPTGREFIVTFFDEGDYQEDVELDKDTKFIFTMNRQTDDDAVLHYFNNYGDSYKNYKVNIFDLEEKFQNKAMLKLAEQQSNHPHFRHIWHGEAKIENHNSLFPFSAFKYENINISDITYVAIGVDPAVSDEKTSDETGIIVAGYNSNTKLYYVLEDASGVYTPLEWGRKINNLYHKYKANVIIAERNQGGDLIKRNLMAENTHNTLNIKTVYARKGKHIRAEPISALIDSGKVIHKQKFSILENQLNSFTPSGYTGVGSPDHADAYVYALQYLVDNYGGRKSIDVW